MAKWTDKTSAISAAISAVCALIAVVIAVMVFIRTSSVVSPDVDYYFDQPPDGSNPVFLAVNTGDVTLRSFSVSHNFYVFRRTKQKIVSHGFQQHFLTNRAIFLEGFKPNEKASTTLVSISTGPDIVAIYKFKIRYYVGDAMKKYEDEVIYFVENKKSFDHSSFLSDTDYRQMINELDVVEAEAIEMKIDPGKLKQTLESLNKK